MTRPVDARDPLAAFLTDLGARLASVEANQAALHRQFGQLSDIVEKVIEMVGSQGERVAR